MKILSLSGLFIALGIIYTNIVPLAHGEENKCSRGEIVGPVVFGNDWVIARQGARKAWEEKVSKEYGSSWSRWSETRVRGFVCTPSGIRKKCYATAKACGRTTLAINRSDKGDALGKKGKGFSSSRLEKRPASQVTRGVNGSACRSHLISARGSDKATWNQAKGSARRKWRQAVREKFGNKWANWSISIDKSYNCTRLGTRFECSAHAQPCKKSTVTLATRTPAPMEIQQDETSMSTNGHVDAHREFDVSNRGDRLDQDDKSKASSKPEKQISHSDNVLQPGEQGAFPGDGHPDDVDHSESGGIIDRLDPDTHQHQGEAHDHDNHQGENSNNSIWGNTLDALRRELFGAPDAKKPVTTPDNPTKPDTDNKPDRQDKDFVEGGIVDRTPDLHDRQDPLEKPDNQKDQNTADRQRQGEKPKIDLSVPWSQNDEFQIGKLRPGVTPEAPQRSESDKKRHRASENEKIRSDDVQENRDRHARRQAPDALKEEQRTPRQSPQSQTKDGDRNSFFDRLENERKSYREKRGAKRPSDPRSPSSSGLDSSQQKQAGNVPSSRRVLKKTDRKNNTVPLKPYFPDQTYVTRKLRKKNKNHRSGIWIKPWPKNLVKRASGRKKNRRGFKARLAYRTNKAAKGDLQLPVKKYNQEKARRKASEPQQKKRVIPKGNDARKKKIAGKLCTKVITAEGRDRLSRVDALKKGRRLWREKVARLHGQAYANLNRSRQYKALCRRKKGKMTCTVSARACRRATSRGEENSKKSDRPKSSDNQLCRKYLVSYRSKGDQSAAAARQKAQQGWSDKVGSFYGARWASWEKARNRKVTCNKWAGKQVCRALALPCQ